MAKKRAGRSGVEGYMILNRCEMGQEGINDGGKGREDMKNKSIRGRGSKRIQEGIDVLSGQACLRKNM